MAQFAFGQNCPTLVSKQLDLPYPLPSKHPGDIKWGRSEYVDGP